MDHLLDLNIGKLYQRMEGNKNYGYVPDVARASR